MKVVGGKVRAAVSDKAGLDGRPARVNAVECRRRVRELFEADRLLIHAHETWSSKLRVNSGGNGIRLDMSESMNKIREVRAGDERSHLSTTLLVKGVPVIPFSKYGQAHHIMLIDSDRVEINSISRGDDAGAVGELGSLGELARVHRMQKGGQHLHNEVTVHLNDESAFIGVAARYDPAATRPVGLLDAFLAHKAYEREGIRLPLFKYDQSAGTLSEWKPVKPELDAVVQKIPARLMREAYASALAEAL